MQPRAVIAATRCAVALSWCRVARVAMLAAAFVAVPAGAQVLAARAKDAGCVDRPEAVGGSLYRCKTTSGVPAYFNVPGADATPAPRGASAGKNTPSPAGFPKVDADTQRTRDEMRRKVLTDELTSEEKLLAEARALYANGAPTPLPEEQSTAAKYQERVARLRQSVALHERNVEALRKELGNTK